MRKRRCREASGCPPRRLDRLLDIHSEVRQVEQRLQRTLALLVTAGTSQREDWFPVLQNKRGLQGATRALERLQSVGVAGHEREVHAAAVERKAQVAHNDIRAKAVVQARLERNDVAVLVHYDEI